MTTVTIDSLLIERPTAYGNTTQYGIAEMIIPNVPNLIAGGAGQTVVTTLVFSEENLPSDLEYTIEVTPSQACAVSWDNKAVDSFDVILTPLTSGVTLAVGTFDVKVTWQRGGAV